MSSATDPAPAAPGLVLRRLSVRFTDADRRAVTALNLSELIIAPGEQVAVSGPSGSGKSTLLHVIAGLVAPDSGEVLWQGRNLLALSADARDAWRRESIGYVFQDFHLIPEIDALGNILLAASFGAVRDRKARRQSALELAGWLGIADLKRPAARLSRGEQQRVAVARALVHRPAIILADEPTASLDVENAALVATALTEGAREIGAALLCASHDPALLARFARRLELTPGGAGQAGAARSGVPA